MNEISNENILSALRRMAWERAQGELQSMLLTFASLNKDDYEYYAKVRERIESFIQEMENEYL